MNSALAPGNLLILFVWLLLEDLTQSYDHDGFMTQTFLLNSVSVLEMCDGSFSL